MSAIDILISQIVAQALANRAGYKIPGYMTLLSLKFVSMISAVAGMGLLIAALYFWFEEHCSLQQTLIYMSFFLFFVSLCAVIISAMVCSIRKRAIRRMGHDFIKATGEVYGSVIAEISDPLKDSHGAALVAALLVGFYIGKKL